MTPWENLDRELDAWHANRRTAKFWWRDDDAVEPTPALDHMLDIAQTYQAPLALAVIPGKVQPELASQLSARPNVSVLQHGFSHNNYAATGEKKAELCSHRPLEVVMHELSIGRRILDIFKNTCPVLVPPWNRIDPGILKELACLGFKGVSTFTPRKSPFAGLNLGRVNAHIDIIDWKFSRGFVGEDSALIQAISHLKAKRLGEIDAREPTGLLSHHLVHDEACWAFINTFLAHIKSHEAAQMLSIDEAIPS